MTFSARNCKVLALCSLFILSFASCEKEDANSIISDQAAPTWAVPADYDMTSSMTVILKVDLAQSFPTQIKDAEGAIGEADVVGAFVGTECVGVAKPLNGLFFLYIAGPKSAEENAQVTLRYYSSILKNCFIAKEALPFKNDSHIGSIAEPFVPEWIVEEKAK